VVPCDEQTLRKTHSFATLIIWNADM